MSNVTHTPSESPREILDIRDLAELLKCSPKHITRMVNRKEFPRPSQVGALRRWERKTVLSWLARGGSAARR